MMNFELLRHPHFTELKNSALSSFEELSYPNWKKAKMKKVDVKEAYCCRDKGVDVDVYGVDGVYITPFDQMTEEMMKEVMPYLERLDLGVRADKLAAFHLANVMEGHVVYVGKNVTCDEAVKISTKQHTADQALVAMTIVIVEESASVEIEESFGSPQDARTRRSDPTVWTDRCVGPDDHSAVICSTSTHVFAGAGSRVKYSSVQNWGPNVYDLGYRQLEAVRDAKIEATFGFFRSTSSGPSVGAGAGRTVVQGVTRGEGAEVVHNGMFVAGDNQRMKLVTNNRHYAPHSVGRMKYKGILTDKAVSNLESMIYIDKDATKTSSELEDAALLLSPDARADAVPALDVHTDDVQCRHSASVKQTDKEQLFYLMSRGLNKETAQQLVVEGFFEEVLRGVESSGIGEQMRELVGARV